jgi:hypothetical protein
MVKRWFFQICGSAGVHWRTNKRLFLILFALFVAGVVVGILTAMNPKVKPESISLNIIDTNLGRVILPNARFGGIIFGRLWAYFVIFWVIFLLCMNRYAVFGVFPITLYYGFSIVMNLYWTILKFGMTLGAVLFVVYFFVLLIYSLIIITTVVYALRTCNAARQCGAKMIHFGDVVRDFLMFAAIVTALAFVEYTIFYLVLSKIVFVM